MVSKHIYRMQSPPLFWDFHSITNMLPVISKPPCGVEWFSKFSQRLKNKLKKCWVLPDFSKWLLSHLARLIHLDLWSSLSGVIWMSLAIVSSMWQPALGSIYLSSSGVKKKTKHHKHIVICLDMCFFTENQWTEPTLGHGLTWCISFNSFGVWYSFHWPYFIKEMQ